MHSAALSFDAMLWLVCQVETFYGLCNLLGADCMQYIHVLKISTAVKTTEKGDDAGEKESMKKSCLKRLLIAYEGNDGGYAHTHTESV